MRAGIATLAAHDCLVRALASAGVNESQVTIVSVPPRSDGDGNAKGDADALDVMKQEETWVAGNQKRAPRTRETLAQFIDTMVLAEARKRPAQGR